MKHSSAQCRSHCPINFVLETFGDRWTLLIIRDLMFKGKKSYGEFLESDEGISTNILAERLRRLEAHGIISKKVDEENRTKHIYALTPQGLDLLPVMIEITAWSAKYDKHTNTPSAFVQAYRKGRNNLIAALRSLT